MKTKIFSFTILLSCSLSFAQTKLADKFFENFGYVKAIELYEKSVEKGDSSAHVLTRLGDAYYNNSNSTEASLWYGEALKRHKKIDPEYLYKYIQALRSIGNYEEADKWFKELSALQIGDSRLKGYNPDEIDIYNKLTTKNDEVVTITNLPINSENSDFGAYAFNNILYFASSRGDSKKVYNWNKEPFLDIYQVETEKFQDSVSYGEILGINSGKINSEYHESSVAITNDGKTLYFTRDNMNKRNRLKPDKDGTTHLNIYKATLEDGQWKNITELPFNDEVYSTGHPALSPDNKTLYMVSDREGGIGQTDIYSVEIKGNNAYGAPQNLGETINTEGREMFPFIGEDNTLYFSSDGHLNLGLLDIFRSKLVDGERSDPENMGSPYNSGYDDFAYFKNPNTKRGYFSSNRLGGKGSDDIYSFNSAICKQEITGVARDDKTNIILAGVNVRLIDETGKVLVKVVTETDGKYTLNVDCNKTYTIIGDKQDYKEDTKTTLTNNSSDTVMQVDLRLKPLIVDDQIVINPIFFDFDKSNIRTDAEYELENIVDVLRKHPSMNIKIESHTDSRGRDAYNLKLSQRRANSTKEHLISRGIDANRIKSAIGYGETQLLNKCANKVKCTNEEHQLNRRSYFYILKD